jgi:opine dehydrogenase
MTPAVARLIEVLDGERRALAQAFGTEVRPIEQHFHRSFDVPLTSLAEIAAELHRRRGGPPGPTTLDTRFVLEDVPFGLAFYAAVARIAGVAVPNIEAATTVLSAAYGIDLRSANPLLAPLRLADTTREELLARTRGSPGQGRS